MFTNFSTLVFAKVSTMIYTKNSLLEQQDII